MELYLDEKDLEEIKFIRDNIVIEFKNKVTSINSLVFVLETLNRAIDDLEKEIE